MSGIADLIRAPSERDATLIAFVEATLDCVKVLDREGRLLAINGPGLCAMEINDFTPFVDQPWADLWPAAARAQVSNAVSTALAGRVGRFTADCPTVKGMLKRWEVTVAPVIGADGTVERLLSVSRDVTHFSSRGEERSLLAQEAGGVGTFEMSLAEGVLRGSPVLLSLYGRPAEPRTMHRDEWIAHIHPDDREEHLLALDAALASASSFSSEYRIRRVDGEVRWISSSKKIERDADGRATGIIGVQQDITDAKRNELLWRTLLSSIPDGLVVADETGSIVSVSEAARRLFGYEEGELVGKNLAVLMPSAHAERHDERLEHYRRTGERRAIGKTNVLMPKRKDGTGFPAEVVIGEALFEGERTFFGFVRDISERQHAERKLNALLSEFAKASRLGSMAQLAGSLAHELNQPLTAVTNYTSAAKAMLARSEGADTSLAAILQGAHEQALRAGAIIKALRAFVTGGGPNRAPFVLAEVIGEATTLAMVEGRGAGILLSIHCSPSLVVEADPVQVQQLIFNLVRNAAEALAGSATKEISIEVKSSSREVVVEVIDSGPGLPRNAGFDPFELFATTKPEGMGVGLALCRTIAEANGGKIWCERKPRGTKFAFTLAQAMSAS